MAQQVNLAFNEVAGVAINLLTIVSVNLAGYLDRESDPMRIITLNLAHGVIHDFVGSRADEFYLWYLQITGQSRIERAKMA